MPPKPKKVVKKKLKKTVKPAVVKSPKAKKIKPTLVEVPLPQTIPAFAPPEEPAEKAVVSQEKLDRLIALANQQVEIENKIEEATKKVKVLNLELLSVCGGYGLEGQLPLLMQEVGVKELSLSTGHFIQVKEDMSFPSLGKGGKSRELVLSWVTKIGAQDLIKNQVTVPFAKGDKKAEKLLKYLEKQGVEFDNFSTINAQTFAAFVRELLAKGKAVPMAELGIQKFKSSKVEAPEKK